MMPAFVDPIAAKEFICVICLELLTQPVMIGCQQHTFCMKCMNKLTSNSRSFRCPVCRLKCKQSSIHRVKFMERQINNLMVMCPNHIITSEKEEYLKHQSEETQNENTNNSNSNNSGLRRSKRIKEKKEEKQEEEEEDIDLKISGHKRKREIDEDEGHYNNIHKKMRLNDEELCDWIGCLSDLNNHIKACELQLVACKYCDISMLQRELKDHHDFCTLYPIQCIKCNKNGILRGNMNTHISTMCPMKVIKCSKCRLMMKRKDEASHLKDNCPETLIKCIFNGIGCSEMMKRKDMNHHITNTQYIHNHIMDTVKAHRKLEHIVNKMKIENNKLIKEMKKENGKFIEEIKRENNKLKRENNRLCSRVDVLERRQDTLWRLRSDNHREQRRNTRYRYVSSEESLSSEESSREYPTSSDSE